MWLLLSKLSSSNACACMSVWIKWRSSWVEQQKHIYYNVRRLAICGVSESSCMQRIAISDFLWLYVADLWRWLWELKRELSWTAIWKKKMPQLFSHVSEKARASLHPSSVDKCHVIGVWELPASGTELASGWELEENTKINKWKYDSKQ